MIHLAFVNLSVKKKKLKSEIKPIEVKIIKKKKIGIKHEFALASEKSLAKDWNSPEEDEAWKDL